MFTRNQKIAIAGVIVSAAAVISPLLISKSSETRNINSGSGIQNNNNGSGTQYVTQTVQYGDANADAKHAEFIDEVRQIRGDLTKLIGITSGNGKQVGFEALVSAATSKYPDGCAIYWNKLSPVSSEITPAFRSHGFDVDLLSLKVEWVPLRSGVVGSPLIPLARFPKNRNIAFAIPTLTNRALGLFAIESGSSAHGVHIETLGITSNEVSFIIGIKPTRSFGPQ